MYFIKWNIIFCDGIVRHTSPNEGETHPDDSTSAQTVCHAQNEKLAKYKIAFKPATIVDSRKKGKKVGMLAQDVSDLIKNRFKESITARKIQQNVKNGL